MQISRTICPAGVDVSDSLFSGQSIPTGWQADIGQQAKGITFTIVRLASTTNVGPSICEEAVERIITIMKALAPTAVCHMILCYRSWLDATCASDMRI